MKTTQKETEFLSQILLTPPTATYKPGFCHPFLELSAIAAIQETGFLSQILLTPPTAR